MAVILLVDDNEHHLKIIGELASDDNHTVLTAKNAEIAIIKLKEHPEIDLLLSDLEMPMRDGEPVNRRAGYDLIKSAREARKNLLVILNSSKFFWFSSSHSTD